MKLQLLTLAAAMTLGAAVVSADKAPKKPSTRPTTATTAATTRAAKPINTICPIMHGEIDPQVTTVYKGQTIGFCCSPCIAKFHKDPEKYMKELK